MNPKCTFSPFGPKGVGQAVTQQQISALLTGLATLLLLALAACVPGPASNPVAVAAPPDEAAASMTVSENQVAADPELMASRRYVGTTEIPVAAARLSENPELIVARRYAATMEIAAQAAFLAANPELMVARR
jgi:glucose/arabinose dehydrogenase